MPKPKRPPPHKYTPVPLADTPCAINLRRIPLRLRADFKAYCARHGWTMNEAIVALMRRAIAGDTQLSYTERKCNVKPTTP